MNRLLVTLVATAAALLATATLPAAAAADPKPHTVRYGPIELGPYEVGRGDAVFNIPKPQVDGFITAMEARLVYADGREVPIANTMLHHVVMADLGRYLGDHQDATCTRFRMFDSQSFLPLTGHRFYGLGEERAKLALPPGYGYPTLAADRWAMTYMLMNHLPKRESVFIEYTAQIEQERALTPITPVWLDVRDCNLDPVFDVPGGGRRGSTFSTSTTWTAPRAGRVVFGLGHMHGGGKNLTLSRPDCSDQPAYVSKPLWGKRSHPYYQVKPLLHEPGPISMTTLQSEQGIPVAAGERLKLTAAYDGSLPHTRAMGIMVIGFAPDERVTAKCAPLPGDAKLFWSATNGRRTMPRITVPITAYDARRRRAVAISRPAGDSVGAAQRRRRRRRRLQLQPRQRAPAPRRGAALALLRRRAAQRDAGQRPARVLLRQPQPQPGVRLHVQARRHLPAVLHAASGGDGGDGAGLGAMRLALAARSLPRSRCRAPPRPPTTRCSRCSSTPTRPAPPRPSPRR